MARYGQAYKDGDLLNASHVLYQNARKRNPRRWSRQTRNWAPVTVVTLNPERETVVRAAMSEIRLSGSIEAPTFPSRPRATAATARNEGDGRSRATRSHAQRSEHGEDGEHRTFRAVSTVASSASVAGSLNVLNGRQKRQVE